ncbi:unnamed protein product [Phaedon cochleariae]|uniref:L-2-hydroxyglutarate dehydrogenase, mitochondrial n=1 Tax=Phaedon cochleariae TaxID=80249 RepID=A0A9P0GVE6_PHACE|nr:unnamed protein product [Phaedon cochleariae]
MIRNMTEIVCKTIKLHRSLWTNSSEKHQLLLRRLSTIISNKNSSNRKHYDVVVVGGGIVGVATAREMKLRNPKLVISIVEKENALAYHQTGNNSGVIHAGIYYKPGSLKAKLCVEGLHLAYKYCDAKNIPYRKVGKLIVASTPSEGKTLLELYERGLQNKVPDLKLIKGQAAIKEIEPLCTGLQAIWSPHTGIVDWGLVTRSYGEDFLQGGGDIYLNFGVRSFQLSEDQDYPVLVVAKSGEVLKAKYVLTCGGLHSDQLAESTGCSRSPRIIPFRGEYLLLNQEKARLINGNIYPVPDPRFPFLGVHFTPRMDGSVLLGPNAVLAFQREGYRWTDVNVSELIDVLSYPGFRKLAWKYASAGLYEMVKSLYVPIQVKELQKFVPSLTADDITKGPAGVRAQALDEHGNLVDDFYFDMNREKNGNSVGDRVYHCRNAPSPGATSSLAIARMIAGKFMDEFKLHNQT